VEHAFTCQTPDKPAPPAAPPLRPRQRAARTLSAAAESFVSQLSATVPATPAPALFNAVRLPLLGINADQAEFLELALDENTKLTEENQLLRSNVAIADDAYDELTLDHEALSEELTRAKAHLAEVLRSMGDLVRSRGDE